MALTQAQGQRAACERPGAERAWLIQDGGGRLEWNVLGLGGSAGHHWCLSCV